MCRGRARYFSSSKRPSPNADAASRAAEATAAAATVATLLTELSQAEIPSVIIDEDEAQARHLLAQGHRIVFGNLDEGVLERCNLAQARALIVNSSDDRNAATILAARQLGYTGEIIALVEDPFHRHPMLLAGEIGRAHV